MPKFFFDNQPVEDIQVDIIHRDDQGMHIENYSLADNAPKEVSEVKVSVVGQFLKTEMYLEGQLYKVRLTPFFRINDIDIVHKQLTESEIAQKP